MLYNLDKFQQKLMNAVEYANLHPNASKGVQEAYKEKLIGGLSNGQYRVVVQAYNSARKTIQYRQQLEAKSQITQP